MEVSTFIQTSYVRFTVNLFRVDFLNVREALRLPFRMTNQCCFLFAECCTMKLHFTLLFILPKATLNYQEEVIVKNARSNYSKCSYNSFYFFSL